MRLPNVASLRSYGKRPAIALLEAMASEQRAAFRQFHEAFKARGEPHNELANYYKVQIARAGCLEKFQSRLREVQEWPDSP